MNDAQIRQTSEPQHASLNVARVGLHNTDLDEMIRRLHPLRGMLEVNCNSTMDVFYVQVPSQRVNKVGLDAFQIRNMRALACSTCCIML